MSARRDPPRPEGTLRVATWNLWCRNGDWRARQPAIFDVLRGVDADVVGFQEVSTREPDQIASLRDELGYAVVTAPDGDDDRHGIANAIVAYMNLHQGESVNPLMWVGMLLVALGICLTAGYTPHGHAPAKPASVTPALEGEAAPHAQHIHSDDHPTG